jgi:hypothetical protein
MAIPVCLRFTNARSAGMWAAIKVNMGNAVIRLSSLEFVRNAELMDKEKCFIEFYGHHIL